MPTKPKILNQSIIAQSRLFKIEQLSLEFSNGVKLDYERIIAPGNGAVLIVPLVNHSSVLMIKEYSAGSNDYQLVFPKGRIDDNESIEDAANRELQEEVGFAARKLDHIHSMTIAPAYLSFNTHIVLAEDLYEQKLLGDEPEPIEYEIFDINDINQLLQRSDLTEARTIATLYMVRDLIQERANNG